MRKCGRFLPVAAVAHPRSCLTIECAAHFTGITHAPRFNQLIIGRQTNEHQNKILPIHESDHFNLQKKTISRDAIHIAPTYEIANHY
ncbi:hypothetical protein PUN4_20026 [Paraburkholderia unamae]|nr:hypothetical protein PUN4_20026 [Paraburkholderia unamae]